MIQMTGVFFVLESYLNALGPSQGKVLLVASLPRPLLDGVSSVVPILGSPGTRSYREFSPEQVSCRWGQIGGLEERDHPCFPNGGVQGYFLGDYVHNLVAMEAA
jgi:hypothetical protein